MATTVSGFGAFAYQACPRYRQRFPSSFVLGMSFQLGAANIDLHVQPCPIWQLAHLGCYVAKNHDLAKNIEYQLTVFKKKFPPR